MKEILTYDNFHMQYVEVENFFQLYFLEFELRFLSMWFMPCWIHLYSGSIQNCFFITVTNLQQITDKNNMNVSKY